MTCHRFDSELATNVSSASVITSYPTGSLDMLKNPLNAPSRIWFGPFEADVQSKELRKHGMRLRLPGQSFQVLTMLLDRPGELVTREELCSSLWPADTFVDFEHGLNATVKRLRDALGDSAENPHFVETLPRRGYRFIAPVNSVNTRNVRSNAPSVSPAGRIAVAVLPLRVLTQGAEDEYLGIALVDALINQLSNGTGLVVRPISAVLRACRQTSDRLHVAQKLEAQISVDGSIQRIGGQIRVHLQISNVPDSAILASLKDEAELHDLFTLQDRLGKSLVRSLRSTSSRSGKDMADLSLAAPTKDATAYELFMRAAELLSRSDRWSTQRAIEFLERATTLDPEFAEAWARLAGACAIMASLYEPDESWSRRAEEHARRALLTNSGDPQCHCALGRVLWTPFKSFAHREALREFRTALRLNPDCHQALVWQGLVMFHVGLFQEAKRSLLAARAISPEDSFTLCFLGQTSVYMGQAEEAEDYFSRAISLDPSDYFSNMFGVTVPLYGGRLNKFEKKMDAARQVSPAEPLLASCEALFLATQGKHARAEEIIKVALHGKSLLHTHHTWHYAAAAYSVMGKFKPAIELLGRASENGLPTFLGFQNDPYLIPLKEIPSYQELMLRLQHQLEAYRIEFGSKAGVP